MNVTLYKLPKGNIRSISRTKSHGVQPRLQTLTSQDMLECRVWCTRKHRKFTFGEVILNDELVGIVSLCSKSCCMYLEIYYLENIILNIPIDFDLMEMKEDMEEIRIQPNNKLL